MSWTGLFVLMFIADIFFFYLSLGASNSMSERRCVRRYRNRKKK